MEVPIGDIGGVVSSCISPGLTAGLGGVQWSPFLSLVGSLPAWWSVV